MSSSCVVPATLRPTMHLILGYLRREKNTRSCSTPSHFFQTLIHQSCTHIVTYVRPTCTAVTGPMYVSGAIVPWYEPAGILSGGSE